MKVYTDLTPGQSERLAWIENLNALGEACKGQDDATKLKLMEEFNGMSKSWIERYIFGLWFK